MDPKWIAKCFKTKHTDTRCVAWTKTKLTAVLEYWRCSEYHETVVPVIIRRTDMKRVLALFDRSTEIKHWRNHTGFLNWKATKHSHQLFCFFGSVEVTRSNNWQRWRLAGRFADNVELDMRMGYIVKLDKSETNWFNTFWHHSHISILCRKKSEGFT